MQKLCDFCVENVKTLKSQHNEYIVGKVFFLGQLATGYFDINPTLLLNQCQKFFFTSKISHTFIPCL